MSEGIRTRRPAVETEDVVILQQEHSAVAQQHLDQYVKSRLFPIEIFLEKISKLTEQDSQNSILERDEIISENSFFEKARKSRDRAHKMFVAFQHILHARITRDAHTFTEEHGTWKPAVYASLMEALSFAKPKLDAIFTFLENTPADELRSTLSGEEPHTSLRTVEPAALRDIIQTISDEQTKAIEQFKQKIRQSIPDLQEMAILSIENQEGNTIDPLTELMNKAGITAHAEEAKKRLESRYALWNTNENKKPKDEPVTVIIHFDINDFKGINTRIGHEGADKLLVITGEIIKKAIRSDIGDGAARMGGDEFCIILDTTIDAVTKIQTRFNNLLNFDPPENPEEHATHPNEKIRVAGGIFVMRHTTKKTFSKMVEAAEIAGFTRKIRKTDGITGLAIYSKELKESFKKHIKENRDGIQKFAQLYARMLLDRLIKQAENQSESADEDIQLAGRENMADYEQMLPIQERIATREINLALKGKSTNETLNALLNSDHSSSPDTQTYQSLTPPQT